MTSDQFLDQYTDIVLRDSNFFPEVLLRMSDNPQRTCPFLSASGCTVYPDRPDSCRTFPVEQGALYDAATGTTRLIRLFRPPDFCQGQYATNRWTTQTWARDQEALIYNQMTLAWSELKRLFHSNPWGPEGTQGPKAKMALMAAYNIDLFREFVFNSTFLKRYKVSSAVLKNIRKDDVELMKFGFDWIRFFVWGMKPRYFKVK